MHRLRLANRLGSRAIEPDGKPCESPQALAISMQGEAMKNWMLGALLSLLTPLSLAGQLNGVKISMVAFNADLNNLFYTLATPAGTSTECAYTVLRLPAIATDQGKGLLSMLMGAQATQSKVNITYKVVSPATCEVSAVQVLSGS